MADLKNQRRMAAEILKCGENRVWMDPTREEDLIDMITRADIRTAIYSGVIRKKQKKGISRGRARVIAEQKKKRKQVGHGSRKGRSNARYPRKRRWINTIRPIRATLRELRNSNEIDRHTYRIYYMRAKGGMFRSRSHLISHLRMEGHIKAPKEE